LVAQVPRHVHGNCLTEAVRLAPTQPTSSVRNAATGSGWRPDRRAHAVQPVTAVQSEYSKCSSRSDCYHGYRVRMLQRADNAILVHGVDPAFRYIWQAVPAARLGYTTG